MTIWRGPAGFRLYYRLGIEFLIDPSLSRVQVRIASPQLRDDAISYLLGPVLGIVLRLLDIPALHGCAVEIDGHAIAIVGDNGAGKSTTAACFASLGHPVIADDIVALYEHNESWVTYSGHRHVHLWPQSVEMIYGSDSALPLMPGTWGKHVLEGPRPSAGAGPYPLASIYWLEPFSDAAPLVKKSTGGEALSLLVPNTYATDVLEPDMRGREFLQLSRVLNAVPLRRVARRRSGAELPGLCRLIADDARKLAVPV